MSKSSKKVKLLPLTREDAATADRAREMRIKTAKSAARKRAIENDEPRLDLECDQDRSHGKLVPLDKLFRS